MNEAGGVEQPKRWVAIFYVLAALALGFFLEKVIALAFSYGRVNDFLVFGTVAVASFGSGQLLHSVGWGGINAGMLPMVAVVLALLGWQSLRQRRGAAIQS